MYTPGSKPFKFACLSIYGTELPPAHETMDCVISLIKIRRKKLKLSRMTKEYKTLLKNYGFDEPPQDFSDD